jgi:4-hydroxy-tetrahydrodipicolinate reductase
MNKIKIALVGAGGRMGQSISQILTNSEKSILISALEHDKFSDLGKLNSISNREEIFYTKDLAAGIQDSDVIIDFGSAQNTIAVIQKATELKKPLVIGVTGLPASTLALIKESSLQIPILQASNMSVGVNLLFKLVEMAAKVLQDSFDIEIQDIHHRHKKDSPSGTANELKKILLKTLSRDDSNVIFGREGNEYSERDNKEIAIHSFRAGEVIGDHTVYFISGEERVEISHKALDRKTFAVGAVKAAEFLSKQKIGLYSMYDVLGI